MKEFVVKTNTKQKIIEAINSLPDDGTKKIEIKNVCSDRSLAQNRLSFLWYPLIGEFMFLSAPDARHYCKLVFGCPILCATRDGFLAAFNLIQDNLTFQDQMNYMGYLDVTSLMTTQEMTEYLSDILLYYNTQGLDLPRPDDIFDQAMGRRRKNNATSKKNTIPKQEDNPVGQR